MKFLHLFILFIATINTTFAQSETAVQPKKDSTTVRYQIGLNGTLDKNLVTRLILVSQNRLTLENRFTKFEPVLAYRFGYVQPGGGGKVNLENDFSAFIENHFLPKNQFFPSVLAAYETSPYIRKLNERWLAGLGGGTYWVRSRAHFSQFNLYGFYENAAFEKLNYQVFRAMPSLKGRHSFANNKFGVFYNLAYAPALSDFQNYRLRANIRPYFKLTKQLDFGMMYDIAYESLVSGRQPNEISTLTFGLTFSNM
jgi:Protein of unknown function, DUF481